jgi:hypothetical protein
MWQTAVMDADVLVRALGQEIGALRVELIAARLQLDQASARVTELENAAEMPPEPKGQ